MDTHLMVADIHRNVLASQGGSDGQHQSVSMPDPFINNGTLIVPQAQARSAVVNINGSKTYICVAFLRVNLHLHHPGSVLDGTNSSRKSWVSQKTSNRSLSSVQAGLERLRSPSRSSTTISLKTSLAAAAGLSVAISSHLLVPISSLNSPRQLVRGLTTLKT